MPKNLNKNKLINQFTGFNTFISLCILMYVQLNVFLMKQISRIFFSSILFFLYLTLFTSCNKDSGTEIKNDTIAKLSPDSSATYKVIITGTWTSPQHTIPAGNHFTPFIGVAHDSKTYLFRLGTLASKGVEDIAEVGNSIIYDKQLDSLISRGKATNRFSISLPNITGTVSAITRVDLDHSYISFMSMIAPSPDWFAGIDSYNLLQGDWVNDVTIVGYGYDAGTEEGDVFAYTNPETNPQMPVSKLNTTNASVISNGNAMIAPFIKVQFVRQ